MREAGKFLRRYTEDTLRRLAAFAAVRTGRRMEVLHADARSVDVPLAPAGAITSPPYPGLIDYHEQHRYAYELLGLEDRRGEEIGPAADGQRRSALDAYVDAMVAAFRRTASLLPRRAAVIVVNDSSGLYPEILAGAGLALADRVTRHVNRQDRPAAGEYFEAVLVCRA